MKKIVLLASISIGLTACVQDTTEILDDGSDSETSSSLESGSTILPGSSVLANSNQPDSNTTAGTNQVDNTQINNPQLLPSVGLPTTATELLQSQGALESGQSEFSDTPPLQQPASGIIEDTNIYTKDGYESVDVIRVDVRTVTSPGICEQGDLSGCTLADVIADTNPDDEFVVDIPVHFSSDDFPNDGATSNAKLRQRGGGTRQAPQKSFRIRLDDRDALWRNERHLQLNKHPFESKRIRNKLSFDLMASVPDLPSLRSQFINLWIDDGSGAVDFGLFTHIERPNERSLSKHGLDPDGNLYQTEFFRFTTDDLVNMQIDDDGLPIDKNQFERALQIEAGTDHREVVAMVQALNDPNRSFASTFDEYFDRKNVLSWATMNILLGNRDAIRHNYLLYSPSNTKKFFFIPWDYDSAFQTDAEPAISFNQEDLEQRQLYGYARGVKNVLLSGFYRLPGIHQEIVNHARLLREGPLSTENIDSLATQYLAVIEPFASREPDMSFNPFFNTFAQGFSGDIEINEQNLLNAYSVPMAPTLLEPVFENGQWIFQWKPAFDVTGNTISYDLLISRSSNFESTAIVFQLNGIPDSTANTNVEQRVNAAVVGTGQRFVRLIARASNQPERFWQTAANRFDDERGQRLLGGLSFTAR